MKRSLRKSNVRLPKLGEDSDCQTSPVEQTGEAAEQETADAPTRAFTAPMSEVFALIEPEEPADLYDHPEMLVRGEFEDTRYPERTPPVSLRYLMAHQ